MTKKTPQIINPAPIGRLHNDYLVRADFTRASLSNVPLGFNEL